MLDLFVHFFLAQVFLVFVIVGCYNCLVAQKQLKVAHLFVAQIFLHTVWLYLAAGTVLVA